MPPKAPSSGTPRMSATTEIAASVSRRDSRTTRAARNRAAQWVGFTNLNYDL